MAAQSQTFLTTPNLATVEEVARPCSLVKCFKFLSTKSRNLPSKNSTIFKISLAYLVWTIGYTSLTLSHGTAMSPLYPLALWKRTLLQTKWIQKALSVSISSTDHKQWLRYRWPRYRYRKSKNIAVSILSRRVKTTALGCFSPSSYLKSELLETALFLVFLHDSELEKGLEMWQQLVDFFPLQFHADAKRNRNIPEVMFGS